MGLGTSRTLHVVADDSVRIVERCERQSQGFAICVLSRSLRIAVEIL